MSGLVIREAREGDEDVILAMLHDFAVFEKLTHIFALTREIVLRDFLGAQRRVSCEIAECEGTAAGLMIWFRTYGTFQARPVLYLEDIWVEPKFRRRGIARAFIKCLAQRAVEEDAVRVDWIVLGWNERAIDFYRSIGAPVDEEWRLCRLKGDALKALARS